MATPQFSSASLYVGDLDKSVTEGQLFEVFSKLGQLDSIRVCRNSLTKESLEYAYVNFHNVADAERALEQLNFTPILGKPCRIMWSQRDPSKRKSGLGNIFIKNLDKSITTAALYDTFSAFGRIVSCKVELDNYGNSKGYGFVAFENQGDADRAVTTVNGKMIADKIVFVGPFLPKKARGDTHTAFTNVYVKNLSPQVTDEELVKLFSPFGEITSHYIMKDEKNESKGFGFVNFALQEQAQEAVEKLNGTTVNGKQMYVGRAQKKQDRDEEIRQQRAEQLLKIQGSNVFVKNLDDTVTDEKLKQEFSRFGTITSTKVMCDDKGNSKGFGFILYSNPEDAARAISDMNGGMFGSKPIYVSLAQSKDVRLSQLAAIHQQPNSMHGMMGNGMRGPVPFQGGAAFFPGPMGVPHVAYPPQMFARPPRMPQHQQSFAVGPFGAPGQVQGQGQGRGGFVQAPNAAPYRGNRTRNPRPPVQQAQPVSGGKVRPQNAQGQIALAPDARNHPDNISQNDLENTEANKQNAGEQLYALILNKTDSTLAGKITGMLLECYSVAELHDIIKTAPLLDSKISEALSVLQAPEGTVGVAPVPVV